MKIEETDTRITSHHDKVPGAGYLTFAELFADARSFEVPDYQRAYDWGSRNAPTCSATSTGWTA